MSQSDDRAGNLPASEDDAGMIPEDREPADDTSLPASETEAPPDEGGEPQSWPGASPGSIPPPG